MAYRRGFKTEANGLATEVRTELNLGPFDSLDPRALATLLDIPIVGLSEYTTTTPSVSHLLEVETEVFSAVTVFSGRRRMIVHNDAHHPHRQNSNLCHELAHGLLHHPATPALDNRGCREWNQDIEDEASWLGAALLVTEPMTLAIAKGTWSRDDAMYRLGVSNRLIQFRLNETGAVRRIARARQSQFR